MSSFACYLPSKEWLSWEAVKCKASRVSSPAVSISCLYANTFSFSANCMHCPVRYLICSSHSKQCATITRWYFEWLVLCTATFDGWSTHWAVRFIGARQLYLPHLLPASSTVNTTCTLMAPLLYLGWWVCGRAKEQTNSRTSFTFFMNEIAAK